MSEPVVPLHLTRVSEPTSVQPWEQPPLPAQAVPTSPIERAKGAVRRYRWLMLVVVLLSIVAGVVATRLVKPQFDVHATIWIQAETPMATRSGTLRSDELLNSQAWVELLRSYRISDAVVRKLGLYLEPEDPADSLIFSGFGIENRFLPGKYEITIDRSHKSWHLALEKGGAEENGAATDSIGRSKGFRWVIPPSAFVGSGEHKAHFTVATPRETAIRWASRLDPRLPQGSSFMQVSLRDANPQLAAKTINTWLEEFVSVAAGLKKRNIVEYETTLSTQLAQAEATLHDAENSLERFRVQTITQPTEGTAVAAGVQATTDPAIKSFFEQRFELEDVSHDRESLERIIARQDSIPLEAVLLIHTVATSPSAEALRRAIADRTAKKADLATGLQVYTPEMPVIRDLKNAIDVLETQTIPDLARQFVVQLKDRERQLSARVGTSSAELQSIPARSIEEMRLRRAVTVDEALYGQLKTKHAEAELAQAATTPDVMIMDTAIAPLNPSKNTAPGLLAMAVLAGLGAAVGLALLLDMLDQKIRYPDQVTNELGLAIAAVIPRFPKGTVNTRSPEQVAQLVESFRSLRMHIRHASDGPVSVAISSPQPGDGKSFVSANLAMSFADAGYRTILVDADTRRGMVHEVFGVSMKTGLTEYLSGRAEISQIVRMTSHEKLAFIPCGSRQPHSPELLTSAALPRLVAELRNRFDVVIFDTPPFAAGIDAYATAAALGSLVVVLRAGKTERRMAAAKLLLVDRLPITILGAVLNAVQIQGEFQYYGYASGYGFSEGEETSSATTLQTT